MWTQMKFGRIAKHQTVGVMLHKYLIRGALPVIPDAYNATAAVKQPISMFLNGPNTYAKDHPNDPVAQKIPAAGLGLCTKASKGIWLTGAHWTAGRPWMPSDSDILQAYMACDGYVPGDDSTDNGGTLLGTDNFFMAKGIGGNILRAQALVDRQNPTFVKEAIFLGNGLDAGVALPKSCLTQEIWDVVDPSLTGDSAPQYGHDTILAAYNYTYKGVVYPYGVGTWGNGGPNPLIPMTQAFFDAYYDELRIILSYALLLDTGKTTSWLAWNDLVSDMNLVESQPPDPVSGDERPHGN